MDRSMTNAASGGALMDKTLATTRHLISSMARNTQEFRIRGAITNKVVNEVGIVDNLRMENQFTELTLPQQYRSSLGQGQYVVPRFGLTPNMPAPNHNYYQQPGSRYPTPLFQQQQQQILTQNNAPSMEEWMKFQQNMNAIMHDLKMQIGQLANSVARSRNLPSQQILNLKGGNIGVVALRSGKELQVEPRSKLNPTDIESELEVDSRRVEINILFLDAIKQIPKYAKFLKDLSIRKRNKLKKGAEVGGVLSAFIQKEVTVETKPALPRKCRDSGIFSVPCTIGGCTFVDAMLDLGASINVMPTSIHKSLNFGDLEPTGIVIQLAN
ncbi:hypothetical protein CR513_47824, partial [Mucuna pruriens]